jgi:tRNA threonylcarbamoyladenosine biosynthesis protein TsaE
MIYKYECTIPEELAEIAAKILKDAGQERFFAVRGPMGAGKTTLIKQLCRQLEVADVVSSPTYAIMNEYQRRDGMAVYHFDFYRIRSISEAYDLGYENFFFGNNYCFVEWPEKIESLLDFRKATIFITVENNHRLIELHTEDQ